MSELLRPPAHRGPLIAAGGVLLALGVVLAQLRLDDLGAGAHLALAAGVCALTLGIGLQWRADGSPPRGAQSVLLVTGFLLAPVALVRAAQVLGIEFDLLDDYPAGTAALVLAAVAVCAALAGHRKRSAAVLLIAALALAGAAASGVEKLADPDSAGPFRAVLGVLALVYVGASLVLRVGWARGGEVLAIAAGVLTAAIGLTGLSFGFSFFGLSFGWDLGAFWELAVLAAGLSLVAVSAADHSPGPGYVGLLNLAVFSGAAGLFDEDSLRWWPLLLLIPGAVMVGIGLRPRRPLPPEPDAYRVGDVPLAARVEGETVVRVRPDD